MMPATRVIVSAVNNVFQLTQNFQTSRAVSWVVPLPASLMTAKIIFALMRQTNSAVSKNKLAMVAQPASLYSWIAANLSHQQSHQQYQLWMKSVSCFVICVFLWMLPLIGSNAILLASLIKLLHLIHLTDQVPATIIGSSTARLTLIVSHLQPILMDIPVNVTLDIELQEVLVLIYHQPVIATQNSVTTCSR